ncbi:MAG: hypothetical protein QOF71_2812 [Candidatus Eremiobacteraeota bacterium]|jgi:hypothetical protein|nr:hypothetical protein [Candidatus Eremiobacteraeota bacterium]
MTVRTLAIVAVAVAAACAKQPAAQPSQPAATPALASVSPAYAAALRAKGAQLAALDRANAERRRAAIARVVTGSARDVTPAGSIVERFVVHLDNHAMHALQRIDGGVTLYGGRGLHRLGLASFSAKVDVPPGRSANVNVAIPLSAFAAEGAGAVARAGGTPKRVELDLSGYQLESGGGARETD